MEGNWALRFREQRPLAFACLRPRLWPAGLQSWEGALGARRPETPSRPFVWVSSARAHCGCCEDSGERGLHCPFPEPIVWLSPRGRPSSPSPGTSVGHSPVPGERDGEAPGCRQFSPVCSRRSNLRGRRREPPAGAATAPAALSAPGSDPHGRLQGARGGRDRGRDRAQCGVCLSPPGRQLGLCTVFQHRDRPLHLVHAPLSSPLPARASSGHLVCTRRQEGGGASTGRARHSSRVPLTRTRAWPHSAARVRPGPGED